MQSSVADHGAIGNLRTLALVDRRASIDWMCWPRMDSPANLCRLLDVHTGGSWHLVAEDGISPLERRYLPDTNVLETTLRVGDSRIVVTDFFAMPASDANQLIRLIRVDGSPLGLQVRLDPTPDFARRPADLRSVDPMTVTDPTDHFTLRATHRLDLHGDSVTAVIEQSDPVVFVFGDRAPDEPLLPWAQDRLAATCRWWRRWLDSCRLPTTHPGAAARSALTVKLLQHEPSSALVAAPTTSLPEEIGGSRNWDYRYTWLRDAAQSVLALQRLDHHDEAMAFP